MVLMMPDIKERWPIIYRAEWRETECDDPIKVELDGDDVWVTYGPAQKVGLDIKQVPVLRDMLNRLWEARLG